LIEFLRSVSNLRFNVSERPRKPAGSVADAIAEVEQSLALIIVEKTPAVAQPGPERRSPSTAPIPAQPAIGPLEPQELTGTLGKIWNNKSISIGYRDNAIPFSYIGNAGLPIGYTIDICRTIVDQISTSLKITTVNINYVSVTSQTRIPLLIDGTIDLECGATTNNAARQEHVAFAVTHWVTMSRFVSKRGSNLSRFGDLSGHTVVSTSGTTNFKEISELNSQRNLGMTIVSAKNHAEAFLMVDQGRASAFVMDDILLYSLIAISRNPSDWVISVEALSAEPYAIMLRKDDPQFKAVIDTVITNLYRSGHIGSIYRK
jgi:glutamate/aspartate transport system substrate-binding protein